MDSNKVSLFQKNRILYALFGILAIIVLIFLDQISKLAVVNNLKGQDDIWLIKNALCFHYLENDGAAFSILKGKMTFFYILTPIVCLAIAALYIRLYRLPKFGPMRAICIAVIAGAIGNYIDRIRLQYVVDFIYFSLIDFPVFNVADIYVTVSVFVMVFLILFYYKEDDLNKLSFKRK